MKRIGLIVAMDKELDLIMGVMSGTVASESKDSFIFNIGNYTDNIKLIIAKSGIGKVNAALCTAALIKEYEPDYIITSGVCGSVAKFGINQGDILVASTIKYHDAWCGKPNKFGQIQGMPEIYESLMGDRDALDAIKTIIEDEIKDTNVYLDDLVTGDWFVDTMQKAKGICTKCFEYNDNKTHACGVDMESAAIAQTCHIYETPFISVRIISDTPLEADSKKYEDFWSNAPKTLSEVVQLIIKNVDYE